MADLDTDGLYPVTWDSCDGCDCSSLFGSPQDSSGRGILLTVTRDGEAVDLSDSKYTLYFLWLHRQQHTRGCVAMEAVEASVGTFSVFFPSGMIGYEGEAVCSIVLSWDDKTISTPTFSVSIDEALASTLAIEDGFTLFAEALKAYEAGTADLLSLVADLTAMRDSGEFDGAVGSQGPKGDTGEQGPAGADGADGKDGVSVTHSWDGTVLTVTSASGTSSANLVGPKGDKGDTGATGETGATGAAGAKGDAFTFSDFTNEQLASLKGEKGDKGETGATGPQGETGPAGPQGPQGERGEAGAAGADGVSCTHSWDGTVLTVTSASGTSSADLKGEKGDKGDTGATGETGATGPQGPAGADGTTFTPASPLSLSDGTLSIDLSGYLTLAGLPSRVWVGDDLPYGAEGETAGVSWAAGNAPVEGASVGDWIANPLQGTLCQVTSAGATSIAYKGVLDWSALRGIAETDLDVAAGETGGAWATVPHGARKGLLLLNATTGALMRVTADSSVNSSGKTYLDVAGLGNVFASGTSFEPASPLSLADGTLSIDLGSYATQEWVKSYLVETFPDLSGVSY